MTLSQHTPPDDSALNTLSRPRAILFDWDNTLADSWPIIHQALHATFVAMGHKPWPVEDIKNGRQGIHRSLRESFPEIFGDRWEEAKEIYHNHFLACHLEEIGMLEGAEDILDALSKTDIYTAIVSNKTGEYLREEVEYLGWTQYFNKVVGATDAAKDKPHPDPVHLALEGSGIEAGEDVWLIGDSETDLECAINTNCIPIFFGDGQMHERFLQHHKTIIRIDNHRNLLATIQQFTL